MRVIVGSTVAVGVASLQLRRDDPSVNVAKYGDMGCYMNSTAGSNYVGLKDTALSGRKCQNWLLTKPHNETDAIDTATGLWDHSYCRNPVSAGLVNAAEPWCFTLDPNMLWEPCGVPECTPEGPFAKDFQAAADDLHTHMNTTSMDCGCADQLYGSTTTTKDTSVVDYETAVTNLIAFCPCAKAVLTQRAEETKPLPAAAAQKKGDDDCECEGDFKKGDDDCDCEGDFKKGDDDDDCECQGDFKKAKGDDGCECEGTSSAGFVAHQTQKKSVGKNKKGDDCECEGDLRKGDDCECEGASTTTGLVAAKKFVGKNKKGDDCECEGDFKKAKKGDDDCDCEGSTAGLAQHAKKVVKKTGKKGDDDCECEGDFRKGAKKGDDDCDCEGGF